jgi:hypothetical protein
VVHFRQGGLAVEELVKTYGPQGAILVAVVLYLRQVTEAWRAREREVTDARLADKDVQITKLERERDDMKSLALRAIGVTERAGEVAEKAASPLVRE